MIRHQDRMIVVSMATQSRGTESTSRSDGEGVLGVIEVVVWLDALETQDWSR